MGDSVNRLYLVRHGENLANITKEFSHRHIDYPLTPKGVLQAQQTAEHLADKGIHAIYSSPLRRAVETAEIIAARLGLRVVVLEELREINVGDLERRPASAESWAFFQSVLLSWLAGKVETAFPGGEDYVTLWRRMRAAIERAVAGRQGQNVVLVGHGGIFTLTLKDLCPAVDLDWLRRSESHNCSISEIMVTMRDGRPVGEIIRWASYAHLHGLAAELVPGGPEPDSFRER